MNESMVNMRPTHLDTISLINLIRDSNANNWTMLEIGSYRGQSAEIFMNTGKIAKIYCVDPWQNGYDNNDIASYSDMAAVEHDFDSRLAQFGNGVVKCKGNLHNFVQTYPDIKPDIVYVDGCHQYDGCKADLKILVNVVQPQVIAGHDYCIGWSGVMRAVDEIVGKPDHIYEDYSWLKFMRYQK